MKAILEFNLPDDVDYHRAAIQAMAMKAAIADFLEDLRAKRKHGQFSEDEMEILDWVHKVAHEYFGEFND